MVMAILVQEKYIGVAKSSRFKKEERVKVHQIDMDAKMQANLQSVELSVTTKMKQPISHLVDFFSLYRIIPQAEIIINYSLRT
jgi:hypothetical protein